MRAVIFRMPKSILGEAEPALRRLRRNLALLALGRTYRPLRQLARFPGHATSFRFLAMAVNNEEVNGIIVST